MVGVATPPPLARRISAPEFRNSIETALINDLEDNKLCLARLTSDEAGVMDDCIFGGAGPPPLDHPRPLPPLSHHCARCVFPSHHCRQTADLRGRPGTSPWSHQLSSVHKLVRACQSLIRGRRVHRLAPCAERRIQCRCLHYNISVSYGMLVVMSY